MRGWRSVVVAVGITAVVGLLQPAAAAEAVGAERGPLLAQASGAEPQETPASEEDLAEEPEEEAAAPSGSGGAEPSGPGWIASVRDLVSQDTVSVALRVLYAILLFVVGWLLAKFLSWLLYRALRKTEVDDRLAERLGLTRLMRGDERDEDAVERVMARGVYLLLMLLVVVGVLQFAGLSQVASPFQRVVDVVVGSLPHIGKAVLILLAAYVAGRVLKLVLTEVVSRMGADRWFAEMRPPTAGAEGEGAEAPAERSEEPQAFSETIGTVAFWLVMVVGLAGAFEALRIYGVAEPMQNAIDAVVAYLPQMGGAAVILLVGWVLARLAYGVLTNLLQSVGFDGATERLQLERFLGGRKPSDAVGLIVLVFILLQAAIAALKELELEALSGPLTEMIAQFWNLLPSLALAILFVVAGVVVGRVLNRIASELLDGIGFDGWMEKLGLGGLAERTTGDAQTGRPSALLGRAVEIGIVVLAVAQGLERIGIESWAGYLHTFLGYAVTHLLVALAIALVGLAIGNTVRELILARRDEDQGSRWMAEIARYAVLVLAITMAIAHLDVAEDFVLIAFALLFGSLCLAVALAAGLGSREVVADLVSRQYERARDRFGDEDDEGSKGSSSKGGGSSKGGSSSTEGGSSKGGSSKGGGSSTGGGSSKGGSSKGGSSDEDERGSSSSS